MVQARIPALAGTARSAGMVLLCAGWAAALVIVAFSAPKLYSLPMIAATLLPVALYASRNPRLFMLVGAALTSVFGLSINFGQRVHMGGAPSIGIDLVDLFLLPLLIFLIRDRVVGLRRGYVLSTAAYWWMGLILLGLFNVLLGPFRGFATYEVVRMLKSLLIFFVIVNECVRERQIRHVAVALACGLALNVVVAVLQYVLRRDLGLQALGEAAAEAVKGANYGVYLDRSDVYRVSALVGHPNLYAAYLAMLLPLFTGLIFAARSLRERIALGVLTVAGTATLVLTLSRTGWAAYAASMLCLMLFLYFQPGLRERWNLLKWAITGVMIVAGVALSGPIILRFTASDSGALDFRYEWLGIAWQMIQDKPLLGWGLNSFSYQLEPYSPYSTSRMVETFGPVWPVVHNIYALVWSEQGTIGLVLFLGFNLHLLWLAWRNTRWGLSDLITMLNVGLFGAVVALLVDGIGSFFMRVPAPSKVFWVLAGLIVASHYWNVRTAAWRRAQTGAASGDETPGPDRLSHHV
jgi:putative inorganic carbon (hco3(-)) transporter